MLNRTAALTRWRQWMPPSLERSRNLASVTSEEIEQVYKALTPSVGALWLLRKSAALAVLLIPAGVGLGVYSAETLFGGILGGLCLGVLMFGGGIVLHMVALSRMTAYLSLLPVNSKHLQHVERLKAMRQPEVLSYLEDVSAQRPLRVADALTLRWLSRQAERAAQQQGA